MDQKQFELLTIEKEDINILSEDDEVEIKQIKQYGITDLISAIQIAINRYLEELVKKIRENYDIKVNLVAKIFTTGVDIVFKPILAKESENKDFNKELNSYLEDKSLKDFLRNKIVNLKKLIKRLKKLIEEAIKERVDEITKWFETVIVETVTLQAGVKYKDFLEFKASINFVKKKPKSRYYRIISTNFVFDSTSKSERDFIKDFCVANKITYEIKDY